MVEHLTHNPKIKDSNPAMALEEKKWLKVG
jgi:hypothetical protein